MASLVFLVLIALSGLILNHSDALGLPNRSAAGTVVLSLYGIDAPPVDTAYEAVDILFATAADTLYANDRELLQNTGELRGAVVSNHEIVIATAEEVFLMTSSGVLVERFAPDLGGSLTRLGIDDERVIAEIDDRYVEFDTRKMSTTELDIDTVRSIHWSQPVLPSDEQKQAIGRVALGRSLNWERVLSDLHSGRILPALGRYIADLTALCLLYLCTTGIVLWFRRRQPSQAPNDRT